MIGRRVDPVERGECPACCTRRLANCSAHLTPRGWSDQRPDRPARTPAKTLALLAAGKRAGPSVATICDHIHQTTVPPGSAVLGVLSLVKKHGPTVVDEAAAAALELGAPTYRFLKRSPPVGPAHAAEVDPLRSSRSGTPMNLVAAANCRTTPGSTKRQMAPSTSQTPSAPRSSSTSKLRLHLQQENVRRLNRALQAHRLTFKSHLGIAIGRAAIQQGYRAIVKCRRDVADTTHRKRRPVVDGGRHAPHPSGPHLNISRGSRQVAVTDRHDWRAHTRAGSRFCH